MSTSSSTSLSISGELAYQIILPRGGDRLSAADARCLHKNALAIKAANILEIGAAGGCSTMVLGNVARLTGGHLYSIDPKPEGRWKPNIDSLGLGQYVTLIKQYSPWVDPKLVKTPIDFLLIDGDHRTKYTIADYQYWQHYVRKNGLVCFHDWTGAGGNDAEIKRAVTIILETDDLREVDRVEGKDKGLIIFEKLS